jgi:hypothetical protein
MLVDDKLAGEEAATGETLVPGIAAGSSSSNQVLEDEDIKAKLLVDAGSNGHPFGSRQQQGKRRQQSGVEQDMVRSERW